MKKVSVIVPIYNVEKYLPKCLDSIVGQTYENLEIICVDDGSPDNSAAIVRSYAEKDDRIILVRKENGGLSSARNEGLKHATGEYTVFVDSDDWIDTETVAAAVEATERDGVEMVMWGYIREYKNSSIEKHIFDSDRVFNKEETRNYIYRRIVGLLDKELSNPATLDSLGTAWGKLYTTKKIKDNNLEFVDTKIIGTEDLLFNTYYFKYVESCKFINKPYNHYRKDNETSLTKKYKPQLFSQWSTLYEMMFDYIKKNSDELSEDFEAAMYNRICLSMIGLGINEHCRKVGFIKRASAIQDYLWAPLYREAYSRLDLSYFPLHWKVFFHYCKMGSATRTCLVIGVIDKIIRSRNFISKKN